MYEFPKDIFCAIRKERNDFLYNDIEIVGGHLFNQYDTIKKIHLYYNSHFETGDYEEINGVTRKKLFYNINKWRCDVSSKMLDLDVANMSMIPVNYEKEWNVFILEKALKTWFRKSKFGKLMNEITRKLPVYGSVVLRKTKDGAKVIDLRFLMNDKAADSLAEGRYVILKHLLTPADLRKKMGVWDNVQEVIDSCSYTAETGYEDMKGLKVDAGTPYAEVYERFGEVPLSFITGKESDDDTFVYSRFIVAGIDRTKQNEAGEMEYDDGWILFKEKIKELPMKEVHYNKTEGRWLGVGVVEDSFEAQRRKNELENQRAKAMEISTLVLFQTRDNLVQKNVSTDVENGDILRTSSEIGRIQTEERNLAAYNNASQEIENLADRLTFSYDIIRGEQAPATSTAFAINTQLQQASSIFDYKRENIGIFYGEYIRDLVIPELKEWIKNAGNIIRLMGGMDEINGIRERIANCKLRKDIMDFAEKNGRIPTPEEVNREKMKMMQEMQKSRGNKEWLEYVDGFFDDLDFDMDIVTTGENRNVGANLQNIQNVLGIIGKNTALLQDPVLRKLLNKLMMEIGMSPSELEYAEQQQAAQQQQMMQAQAQQVQQQPTQQTNATAQ